jgi:ABC-type multidrug transport system fused ATPase/permease subunit
MTSAATVSKQSSTILRRLFFELRPEWPYLGAALSTQLITSASALAVPAVCGKLVDASYGNETQISHFLATYPVASCGLALGFFAFTGSANLARATLTSVAGERFALRLRSSMVHGAAERETSYLGGGKLTPGDLQTRIVGDVAVVQKATSSSIKLVRSILTLSGGIPLLVYTSPTLSIASLCLLPPMAWGARTFGTSMKQRQTEVQKSLSEASSVAGEFATHFKLIRQFGGEKAELERFDSHAEAAAARAIETSTLGSLFEFAVDGVAQAAVVTVVAVGLYQVKSGVLTPGSLANFVMLSLMVANHSWSLSSNYTKLMRGTAAAERIFNLSSDRPEQKLFFSAQPPVNVGRPSLPKETHLMFPGATLSGPFNRFAGLDSFRSSVSQASVNLLATSSISQQNVQTALFNSHLMFQNVHFSYDKVAVLAGLNLNIDRGTIVAIIGSSGSGKSTLSALATRLYDPLEGQVFFESENVKSLSDLRFRLAVVDQDHILLNGSILDNVRYANRDADMNIVKEALRVACATEFVETKGYDFEVGAGSLSGGMRQRIAIARAVVKVLANERCKLLFLDEGLSNLDRYTGQKTWENICNVADDMKLTIVHVTHQHGPDLMDSVDKIIRLEHGKVIEERQGTRRKK